MSEIETMSYVTVMLVDVLEWFDDRPGVDATYYLPYFIFPFGADDYDTQRPDLVDEIEGDLNLFFGDTDRSWMPNPHDQISTPVRNSYWDALVKAYDLDLEELSAAMVDDLFHGAPTAHALWVAFVWPDQGGTPFATQTSPPLQLIVDPDADPLTRSRLESLDLDALWGMNSRAAMARPFMEEVIASIVAYSLMGVELGRVWQDRGGKSYSGRPNDLSPYLLSRDVLAPFLGPLPSCLLNRQPK